ncbi:MAG: hypothetical protein RIC18_13485 [Hoeflea sp.]|uniref:hypothetical protein n=1 Tax=Hoeflea sp. TaxID=1940281 RepID=UPI0032EB7D4B
MKTARKQPRALGIAIASAIVLAGGLAPTRAAADAGDKPAYDRRIEEAAIRMLQPKLGEIRGSLDLIAQNHLYPPLSRRMTGPQATPNGREPVRSGNSGSILRY